MSEEQPTLNLLDKAIGATFPRWGARRAYHRQVLFNYDSASGNTGRSRGRSGGLITNAASETWKTQRERLEVMWDARNARNNVCFIDGILKRLGMYVCQKISYQAQTGDENIDKIYTDYFHEWCGQCDITGRHRLRKLIEMGFVSMLCDGDFLFLIIRTGRDIKLQSIEADRLGSPTEISNAEDYIGGITIGGHGEPTSYRVFKRTRTAQYKDPKEYRPEQVIHLFDPRRTDEYRPVSYLQNALPLSRDLYEMFKSELQAMKYASSFSGFFLPRDPYAKSGNAEVWDTEEAGPNGKSTNYIDGRGGKIVKLDFPGEISFPDMPNRPSGAFIAGVEAVVREACIGLDIPFGFGYNLALLGGVAQRIELMQAQRKIQSFQENIIVERGLNPIKDAVIANGIAMRDIPPVQNWRGGVWQFGAWLSGDVQYQTNADIQLAKMGWKTGTSVTDSLGEGFEEISRRNAKEVKILQQVALEENVPIEMIAPDRFPLATSQLAAANTPPAPPPTALIDKFGAQNLKPLLDVLEQVGDRKMDRESAIATLVQTYNITDEEASQMVPEPPEPEPEPEPAKGGKASAKKKT